MSNGNKFATNQGGILKSPKPKNQPVATVVKGSDLRNGTKKSK